MGRRKDERYWNQVEPLGKDCWQCKHCGQKFKGGVSRIKAHIEKIPGKGIAACRPIAPGNVPDNEGVDNNIAVGSSNPQEVVTAMNSSEGPAPEEAFNGNFESEISQIKELVDNLTWEEDGTKGQLQWLESRGEKRKRPVDDWLKGIGDLRKRACDMNNSVDQFGPDDLVPLQQLTEQVWRHKQQKPWMLSNEFEEIWNLLMDDRVFIVGIHGMGGMGKTCLVTHIKNEITRNDTFKHVFWVTVSQNFSILKLQDDIAKRIGVKLDEDDERIRAEILSLALKGKEKSVLILDDVWSYIDLQKVGIPLRVNGLKLILTSRLKHVCQQMDCKVIRMKPLSEDEAWELFLLKLGSHGTPATLPHEVLDIARSVAEECHGLPLEISVMARTMKGIYDIRGWKHNLNKLQNRAMEEEVFKVLKLSYDNLMDKNIQNCFLHCALYKDISAEELIMNLVDEGLINEKWSLEEIFLEGRIILDKLKGHSLLMEGYTYLWMHGLVRDMACHILKESHRYMVKCDEGLTKMPHLLEWSADLEKVSLMQNNNMEEGMEEGIKEIPARISPSCPQLSTLIFSRNGFDSIPDCFFSHMKALAILDLSHNEDLTCLPNSVSNLTSLKSLLLGGCSSLEYVPPLGQLNALSRLVISGTSIEEVPRGLEMLINLKWLDLSWNDDLECQDWSVLRGLTKMQYLDLRCGLGSTKLKVEDVQGMTMLEFLAGSFQDGKNFSDYVRKTQERGCGPRTYFLELGNDSGELPEELMCENPFIEDKKTVIIRHCEEFPVFLPRNLAELYITETKPRNGCLFDALSFNDSSSLRFIGIKDCPELESLFCLSRSCSFCSHIRDLESLLLYNLGSVAVIWKENDEAITKFFPSDGMFSNLRRLEIEQCLNMEKLLTPGSLPQLQNLEEILVENCDSMTEIFAVSNSNDDDSSITLPMFLNLKRLEICGCRNMEKLLTPGSLGQLPNLEEIKVWNCDSMTEIFAVSNSNHDDSSITHPMFLNLKRLEICGCRNMEKLLTPGSLRHLPNLEEIKVKFCSTMTEIFAVSNSNDDDSSITLPKLRNLSVINLPKLKIVCRGIIVCGSSEVFFHRECPNLQRLPTVQVFSESDSRF